MLYMIFWYSCYKVCCINRCYIFYWLLLYIVVIINCYIILLEYYHYWIFIVHIVDYIDWMIVVVLIVVVDIIYVYNDWWYSIVAMVYPLSPCFLYPLSLALFIPYSTLNLYYFTNVPWRYLWIPPPPNPPRGAYMLIQMP
jgi:hypothetical protein